MRLAVIVDAPQIIAVWHGRESSVERKNFQAVAREVQIANDFRSQQRNHVRTDRELEARKNFFGHRRSAEHMAPLQHQNFLAGTSQISRIGESVMAYADHDHVV